MFRNRRWWILAAGFVAFVLVVVCLVPEDLWARAGGGGGYRGGGGGGGGGGFGGGGGGGFGGGGGGGGDGGNLIFLLIWLCVKHPYIGIPLLLLLVAFFVFGAKRADEGRRTGLIRRGNLALGAVQRRKAVESLRVADPQFEEQRFYDRVSDAFSKIQVAWSNQDLTPVRPFISDGITERFSLQFREQRDFGYRPQVSNIVIHEMQLAQFESGPIFELVTVRIHAACVAYRVKLGDGSYVSGNRSLESFVEYWTFLRRRGVQTTEKPGLMEGNCPNCGADVRLNMTAQCTSCDSLLRSGQHDWVLCEITQQCEWTGDAPEAVVGAAEYRERDPGFNARHLEDRASVVFWRKVMADRRGEIAPLAKVASPEFCQRHDPQRTASTAGGGRAYLGDCAVGSVETRGVSAADPMDEAFVEVRWTGTRFVAAAAGPPQRTNHVVTTRSLLVFQRRTGVITDPGRAVSSAHCPSCGAPEEALISHACEFCGEVLNDGSVDWVLTEFVPMSSEVARQRLRSLHERAPNEPLVLAEVVDATPHGTELLIWIVAMALADNELDAREQAMLQRVAQHRNVPPATLEAMIEAGRSGELETPQPADPEQARRWLTAMADLSLIDGEVHRAEFQLLCQAAAHLNMSTYDVKRLLKHRRTRLYKAAKRRLKDVR